MPRLLLICSLLLLLLRSAAAAPGPQFNAYDSSAQGSILSPWGGNLGGSYSNPYGSFANSGTAWDRYSNALGTL